MKGLIFSIKRYSIHDGPGIRVTFFLKGCPLSCRWCHNPEGISPVPEDAEITERVGDEEFSKVEKAGNYYDAADILRIIARDKIFIQESKGGVTFSGGEPLLQIDFLLEALKACRENGYHTAVDTSGYSRAENFKAIIPFTNLFLFDIKHLDNAVHEKLTSVQNTLIISNFRLILESGSDLMVRFPVIPGYNDDYDHLERLRSFLLESKAGNLQRICLLPYHKIGISKYKMFRIPDRMDNMSSRGKEWRN